MLRRAATTLVVLVLALLGVGPAIAQGGEGGPRRWSVVQEQSSIALSLTAFGGRHEGRFGRWRGDVRFDPARPEAAAVTIEAEAASLRMQPDVATRRAIGPGFLDAQRHPTLSFRLKRLEPAGAGRFTALADVTVKGRTQPVSFPIQLSVEGRSARMTGGFSLDRRSLDIGMGQPWNTVLGRQVRVDVVMALRAP